MVAYSSNQERETNMSQQQILKKLENMSLNDFQDLLQKYNFNKLNEYLDVAIEDIILFIDEEESLKNE